jgi:CBS-domain-containing membrane protein
MRARDVMTTDVVSVSPEASVRELAQLLIDRGISGVPVIDENGQLVGIVTEGDMTRRAELTTGQRPWWLALADSPEARAQAYAKAHGLTVRDIMTRDVLTIQEEDPLDRIAMLFEERGVKRAPVMRDGRVVGIVSRANLLQGLVAAKTGTAGPDDEAIRSAIMRRMREEAGVRASLVSVTVVNGVVDLWGNVASEAERSAVRVAAETTEGVREVHDHLRLIPPSVLSWKPE